MDEMQVIVPAGMFGANEFDSALDKFLRLVGEKFQVEGDWAEKYGARVDNDVFMMRPFCWCEREGECPWCTGCGAYEDVCRACQIASKHGPECYQVELKERQQAAGLSYWDASGSHDATVKRTYDEAQKVKGAIYDELCAKHGVDRNWGAAVHCDCGAEEAGSRLRKTDGCPYVLGTEIFAPFQPYTQNAERQYYDPPNFWYKPLDFRVTWYKYIGRSTATNKDLTAAEFNEMWQACLGQDVWPESVD
jgi:hypothetical protein